MASPSTINEDHRWNPGVAALLSFLIPGAGQIYKNQLQKGFLLFVVAAVIYASAIYFLFQAVNDKDADLQYKIKETADVVVELTTSRSKAISNVRLAEARLGDEKTIEPQDIPYSIKPAIEEYDKKIKEIIDLENVFIKDLNSFNDLKGLSKVACPIAFLIAIGIHLTSVSDASNNWLSK